MQVLFGLASLHAEWQRAVLCIGAFDGVHLGHRKVIQTAVDLARKREQPCLLVTFDRHPAATLAPDKNPTYISCLEQNLEIFESLGVALALILAFDRDLSICTAADFLDQILVRRLSAEALVVGHDFAMGHNREGNAAWLQARIQTTVVPPFELNDARVSSSVIRKLIADGDVKSAAEHLGRPFELSGIVVPGRRIGRTLGFPTANVARSCNQVVPADGVYAGSFQLSDRRYVAAVGIGVRPAVGGSDRTIEAHLLDFEPEPLYGRACRLAVVERLREERDFPTREALALQIESDVKHVRRLSASLRL